MIYVHNTINVNNILRVFSQVVTFILINIEYEYTFTDKFIYLFIYCPILTADEPPITGNDK